MSLQLIYRCFRCFICQKNSLIPWTWLYQGLTVVSVYRYFAYLYPMLSRQKCWKEIPNLSGLQFWSWGASSGVPMWKLPKNPLLLFRLWQWGTPGLCFNHSGSRTIWNLLLPFVPDHKTLDRASDVMLYKEVTFSPIQSLKSERLRDLVFRLLDMLNSKWVGWQSPLKATVFNLFEAFMPLALPQHNSK